MWSLHHISKAHFRRCARRGKGIPYSYPHTWAIGIISTVVTLSLPKNSQNKRSASQFRQSNLATASPDSTISLQFCLLCFSSDFCLLSPEDIISWFQTIFLRPCLDFFCDRSAFSVASDRINVRRPADGSVAVCSSNWRRFCSWCQRHGNP